MSNAHAYWQGYGLTLAEAIDKAMRLIDYIEEYVKPVGTKGL